jgi:hypothetical protein
MIPHFLPQGNDRIPAVSPQDQARPLPRFAAAIPVKSGVKMAQKRHLYHHYF